LFGGKMKKLLISGVFVALFGLALAGSAKADTTVDTTNDVTYNASSVLIGTNEFAVTLTVDTSLFNQGPGFLTSVAMQFTNATAVSLLNAPGGVGDWSAVAAGGTNANGCDGTGNFWCTQNITGIAPVPAAGIYTFVFDVSGSDGSPGTDSDVKAEYAAGTNPATSKNLGQTSQGIVIGSGGSAVPEPGSLPLLGVGLIAVFGLAGRKLATA
jgi:PEP-CTERM motif